MNQKISDFEFPEDLAQKGNEMTKGYYNLYILENFLRLFIEKIGGDKLKINPKIQKIIEDRKSQHQKNKWLSFRPDYDLYYTDFKDLRAIINNNENWELFKKYFPDETWIKGKLDELYQIRNAIAHNTYINRDNQDLLKSYSNAIFNQLKTSLRYEENIEFIVKAKPKRKYPNKFEEFQDLILNGNFKRLFAHWNQYCILFSSNNAFVISPPLYTRNPMHILVRHRLDKMCSFELSLMGDLPQCKISIDKGVEADNLINNKDFNEIAKQFFECIKDSIN